MAALIEDARRFLGRSIDDLPTPCLTLERPLLEGNLAALQGEVRQAGKALRAHAKSHKCTQLARRQVEHGAIGICAAKLSEAERLVAAGVPGVLVTGPIVSSEAHERLAQVVRQGGDIIITLDSEENARALSKTLGDLGGAPLHFPLRFLLDVDIGQARTGVPPAQALEMAERLSALPGLSLVGVQAYAGHVQHLLSREERQRVNGDCLRRALEAFHAVQGLAGGVEAIFSVGGTGSYEFDLGVPEVTEVQAGSYALMDADYLAVEPSKGDQWRYEAALKLRTRVMSTQQRGFITVDAGLKTVYRDGPAPLVVQAAGGELAYDWFGDEYGRISGSEEALARLKVGVSLDLIVSHCDPTVNLFDFFYVIEEGVVVDLWPIDLRGCCF